MCRICYEHRELCDVVGPIEGSSALMELTKTSIKYFWVRIAGSKEL
jgi:hypothetical protein